MRQYQILENSPQLYISKIQCRKDVKIGIKPLKLSTY